ncbi:hypothetical protein N9L19_01310 [bacterium]|nr:hypothetical protein [bacterium]
MDEKSMTEEAIVGHLENTFGLDAVVDEHGTVGVEVMDQGHH